MLAVSRLAKPMPAPIAHTHTRARTHGIGVPTYANTRLPSSIMAVLRSARLVARSDLGTNLTAAVSLVSDVSSRALTYPHKYGHRHGHGPQRRQFERSTPWAAVRG